MKNAISIMQALRAENTAKTMLLSIKSAIVYDISCARDNDVVSSSGSGLVCVMVPPSLLRLTRSLQVETYLPEKQATLVKSRLSSCGTASALLSALVDMTSCGYVDLGGVRYALNQSTLLVLKGHLKAGEPQEVEPKLG